VTLIARARVAGTRPIVELAVADTGIGIASADRHKLFTKFGRLSDAHYGTSEGTGLGLYLSRGLAHLLGGEIAVESEPGRGSRFTVHLPQSPNTP